MVIHDVLPRIAIILSPRSFQMLQFPLEIQDQHEYLPMHISIH